MYSKTTAARTSHHSYSAQPGSELNPEVAWEIACMEELKHCFCPGQQYVGCFLYQLCNISTCAYTYNHFFYLFLLDWCMNQLLSFSHMSNRFFLFIRFSSPLMHWSLYALFFVVYHFGLLLFHLDQVLCFFVHLTNRLAEDHWIKKPSHIPGEFSLAFHCKVYQNLFITELGNSCHPNSITIDL